MEQQPGASTKNNSIDTIHLRSLAYLGDAVYELFIRKKFIFIIPKSDLLHKKTTSLVKSDFHAELLDELTPYFNEEELKIIKRARNIRVTTSKRKDHAVHRSSTSFEALIGYLHLTDQERLKYFFDLIENYIDQPVEPSE